MSEEDEIAWGKVADQDVQDNLRTFDDAAPLQHLVHDVGTQIASQSTRPELPWTFRVLDDPAINAFALPGGHVYVTRGLLTHLLSEDELAAVIAHEVGHIEARHAAIGHHNNKIAGRKTGFVTTVADPQRSHATAVATGATRLELLAYGRAGELQADKLGLGYLQKTEYDPHALLEVFTLLGASELASARVPSWLSTHPQPQDRAQALASHLGESAQPEGAPRVSVDYLSLLDDVVYGPDPREGVLDQNRYIHCRVGFAFEFPDGWALAGDASGVTALAPDNLSQFGVAPKYYTYETAEKATYAFFISGTYIRGETVTREIDGGSVLLTEFVVPTRMGEWRGLVGFADFGGHVVAMLASAPANIWPQHAAAIQTSFASLSPVTASERAALEPDRIEIVQIEKETTLSKLLEARPGSQSLEAVALLNRIEVHAPVPSGATVKLIRGADLPAP